MNGHVYITIEGPRPWINTQKSGISINLADLSHEQFLRHLRLALDALYKNEERKYNLYTEEKTCQSTHIAVEDQSVDTSLKLTSQKQTQQETETLSDAQDV